VNNNNEMEDGNIIDTQIIRNRKKRVWINYMDFNNAKDARSFVKKDYIYKSSYKNETLYVCRKAKTYKCPAAIKLLFLPQSQKV
jgi:hypothetical protein